MQEKIIKTIVIDKQSPKLVRLHTPPKQLNYRGNISLLNNSSKPTVGIIGARKFSPYGRKVTTEIAEKLARSGVVVVSGLALGIDSIAHKACIDAEGFTIAVLPSGLKNIYPASHRGLAEEIVRKKGLLISEYDHNFMPYKTSFLERNRLIAALSDILIITEAAERSGSLNTASHALEIGVSVMAVPGDINSPLSVGTNKLIQSGAEPLTSYKDVLQILGVQPNISNSYLPENKVEMIIIDLIQNNIRSTNELIKSLDIDQAEIQSQLSLLEIKGVISSQGGVWSLN